MKKKIGILLVNLGTPDSPGLRDVHKYLVEFLTDKRVIDK
ncbi:MAG TPA: ferrochelatase, partial [Parachlamydiaceae bacterium]|nr:ferrochelatase [Parachlamydiaceae bacterium]